MKPVESSLLSQRKFTAFLTSAGHLLVAIIVSLSLFTSWQVPEKIEAAVTVRGSEQIGSSGEQISLSVNKPTGTVENDVLVAIVGLSAATGGTQTVTPPSGWIEILTTSDGTNVQVTSFYKIATGTEPASYTFSWVTPTRSALGITSYEGVDTSNVIDVSSVGNTGTGTSVTATGATTTSKGARVVAAYASNDSTQNSYTPPSGMVERIDVASSTDGSSNNAISMGMADVEQVAPGATGDKTATCSQSTVWAAHLFALTPAPPKFDQASFRFLSDVDAIQSQYKTVNHTAGDDLIGGSAADTVNGYFYVGGYNTTWVIEKRRIIDAALDSSFGTGGTVTQDIAGSTSEGIVGIALDIGEGVLFVAGWDRINGTNDAQWRIEKRTLTTGALVTDFGTSGVVTSNPTTLDDLPTAIMIDNTTNHIIVGGFDSNSGNGWRIEKRNATSGALDTGFGTSGVIQYNPSGKDERIGAMAVDEGAGFFYVTGFEDKTGNTSWRVEKRRISDGALCTAANCGTQFGTNGVYEENPSSSSDQALTIQVDVAGDALFFGGYQGTSGDMWRISKVNASTGALITEFGGGTGSITSDTGGGQDRLYELELDGFGGFLYAIGSDNSAGNEAWRIEKRRRSDGSLVTTWGNSGRITVNPSTDADNANQVLIDIDKGILYGVGSDRSLGASNAQWRFEQYVLDTGIRWLGDEDAVTIANTKIAFRIRMVLHVSEVEASPSITRDMKLQYAFKVGTCDTAFMGEIYKDMQTNSGEIRYHDNPTLTDGSDMVDVAGDPSHGTDAVIKQSYEEASTAPTKYSVPVGQDGIWDLSLRDHDAFGAYCFRLVYDDGTPLDSYSLVPEVSFCKDDPRAENVMRHGTYFCEGTKRAFFWAL